MAGVFVLVENLEHRRFASLLYEDKATAIKNAIINSVIIFL